MRPLGFPSILISALIAFAGVPAAQDKGIGVQPPAKQSAPSEAGEPAGHDAQSGKPETAEKPKQITLTEEQAKSWIDKPVYGKDGKELGEVAAFKRSAENTVIEMHADIGGMLGIGETRVVVPPGQFQLKDDRVILNLTQEQAKALPKVEN
jgi:hypothetical protein